MINSKSLLNQLENNFSNAIGNYDDAAMNAAESADVEDMRAFVQATQSLSTAATVMSEGMRAHHGMNKAIIDGIQ
ncbi:type III secretion protein [Pseudomonas sp. FP1154]|jgi:hypothetical protein|uniref:Type III secretion protein n=1 Tax=Pseudomonas rhizophila TaxID=2045200 RepID=A0ABM6UGU9_9PSED|nr:MULTISPECIES: type III secretion protein [Pseudomonas]AVU76716.1 type III secretion protein [Pseudomonas rhizophila]MXR30157.1 type III secretion protein [Pseudomonas sp. PICF6]WLG20906.1 type III secretion protein [Pseudomonas sp. FP1154]